LTSDAIRRMCQRRNAAMSAAMQPFVADVWLRFNIFQKTKTDF
jgi:hypothetical protein